MFVMDWVGGRIGPMPGAAAKATKIILHAASQDERSKRIELVTRVVAALSNSKKRDLSEGDAYPIP